MTLKACSAGRALLEQRGIAHLFYYIDDFIALAAPESLDDSQNGQIMHETSEEMGLPSEPEKDDGTISFLGMELDSLALEICLSWTA